MRISYILAGSRLKVFVLVVSLLLWGALPGSSLAAEAEPATAAHPHDPTSILTTAALRALPPLPETDVIRPTGVVREFTLVAGWTEWEIVAGVRTEAMVFNQTTPGPTVRVTEGDLVRITVVNELSQPTSVHWHGLHVPFEMDGVPPYTQDEIQPGESFTYEFLANHAGTFMYHSHASEYSIEQIDRGLYGLFIIDPQDPTGHPVYNKEFDLMIGAWSVETDGMDDHAAHDEEMSDMPTAAPAGHAMDYNYWTLNGKAFPDTEPMEVAYGDRVRVRLTNVTNAHHPMHLHGHDFRVIAEDGHPLAQPRIVNTLDIAPGKTYEIDFIADNPGVWVFHCHELHHTANDGIEPGGMVVVLQYEGYEALGAAPAPAPETDSIAPEHPGHGGH